MKPAAETRESTSRRPVLLLWIAYLAPLLAWFGQLNVNFFTIAYACAHDRIWILHLIAVAALLIAIAGTVCGWRSLRYYPKEWNGGRFLGVMSVVLGGIYILGILYNVVPNIMMEPCR